MSLERDAAAPLRDSVLEALRHSPDAPLSGQALAARFGVSRNAVWKAVSALKAEGYVIDAGTRRGYCLRAEPDALCASAIRAALASEYRDMDIRLYASVDSTNNEAKRLLAGGFCGRALLLAQSQTQGRGRRGRDFFSPEGGLYMSLILPAQSELAEATAITAGAAVAVVTALERLSGCHPQIKWVNDVYVEGRKVCGILTEALSDMERGVLQSVVIGIGVNLNTAAFPEALSGRAAAVHTDVSRNRMAAEIANELLAIWTALPARGYMARYRSHSMALGKRVRCEQGGAAFTAMVLGVDEDGGLIVRREDGTQTVLRGGEITLRLTDQA